MSKLAFIVGPDAGFPITSTAIVGIALFVFSLILLAIPGRGCFARIVKLLFFLGVVAIAGFNLYTVIIEAQSSLRLSPIGSIPINFHLSNVADLFLVLAPLQPHTYGLFDYIGAIANGMTIITSLWGIYKDLRGPGNLAQERRY